MKINNNLNFSCINTKPIKKIRQLPIISAPLAKDVFSDLLG